MNSMRDPIHTVGVASHCAPPVDALAANAAAMSATSEAAHRDAGRASELLKRLFRNFDGSLALRLWDGTTLRLGNAVPDESETRFTLVLRNPSVVRSMALGRDPLRLAEAYFRGDIDIEGDFFAALGLKDRLQSIRLSSRDRLGALFSALRLPVYDRDQAGPGSRHALRHDRAFKAHSKTGDRDAIQFHYDVSNKFYALWLDKAMVYSCAYFEQPGDDLDHAQQAKLDHICRKLLLKPGDRFLDIGCGWGALVIHAAQHYGVQAHGVTLSRQQLDLARQRIAQAGLEDRVTVELQDYRDLAGEGVYDKVSSIGMFEHVGLANQPTYLATVQRVLRPGGLFLNHGITHDKEGWNKTMSSDFINRYVFPDGELDRVSNIQLGMERAGFEIHDVEGLRPHYALTLRHWVRRLQANREAALREVEQPTYRVWRLYMAACALEFEAGGLGVYQFLASKRNRGESPVALSRRGLYAYRDGRARGLN